MYVTYIHGAKVGLQSYVKQSLLLALLFINCCIILHPNNCKPPFAHAVRVYCLNDPPFPEVCLSTAVSAAPDPVLGTEGMLSEHLQAD